MTADTVGGVWTYAIELARALQPRGVEVVLATMGARCTADQRHEARLCRNVELAESAFKLEWMQEPWTDVERAGEWLLELEQTHAPDVVHLNGYAHAALAWSAPVIVAGHSCVRSWWTAVRGGAPNEIPREWDEYTRRVRAGLAASDLVIAPTHAMLRALETHYGPLGPSRVISNGRALHWRATAAKERMVLSAGRAWDDAKNVAMLARVAPELPWPVAIAGELTSPDGGSVTLAGGVRWLGRLDGRDLAQWMARAGIYALPARYEPFGLSALEAALSGCALVLGDIPSLREVWGDAATFVAPDDGAALVEKIASLCADADLRQTMSRRARARGAELSPGRMAAEYVTTYARLCEQRAAAGASPCAS